ncbi:MAG: hypothetical protein AB7V46_15860 [Thermomicrobiales bacterium]
MQIDTASLRWWEFDWWEADRCHEVTTLNRVFGEELSRFRRHYQAVDSQSTG